MRYIDSGTSQSMNLSSTPIELTNTFTTIPFDTKYEQIALQHKLVYDWQKKTRETNILTDILPYLNGISPSTQNVNRFDMAPPGVAASTINPIA